MRKLIKIKLQNGVVLENSEMKTIYGGSGGEGGSGHCYDGEQLYTCTLLGASGVEVSGLVCATNPVDAAERAWLAHGGSGEGYEGVSCS